jgi:nucleoside phosphorylase
MQDRITLHTLRRFLSECLSVLRQEGRIDQAVAIARGAVREQPDFWVPVLFLRSQSGRLWSAPGRLPAPPPPVADRTPVPAAPASADPSHGALTMPTPQDIADQNDHLTQARQNVQILLKQIARHGGESHTPLNILNTLSDARREIARRKAILRGWGAPVEEHPDDGDARPTSAADPAAGQGRGNFISGGTFYGPVIGHQENRGGPAPAPAPDQAPARQADVLLVTVTDGETRAVFGALQAATGQRPQPLYRGDKTYYNLGRVGGARVWLVRSEMGSLTVGGSFPTLYAAIDTLRPAAVLLVGVAFGTNPAAQRLGDVLVARQLAPYEPQRVSAGPAGEVRLTPRGDRVTVSTRVLDRCRDGALSWPDDRAPVRFGLVLSGEKLLDHAPTVASLLAQEPEAIGGEMEGAGLYVAAAQRGVAWGLVKAVCDWADGRKGEGDEEERQERAARNAAAFAAHVLAAGGFAPEAWQG